MAHCAHHELRRSPPAHPVFLTQRGSPYILESLPANNVAQNSGENVSLATV